MAQVAEKITDIMSDYMYFFRRVGQLSRRERRSLLRLLCDGYASANFGYEGVDYSYTLDEGDLLKTLIDYVCRSMFIAPLDHYALEEIYVHPVVKDETPEQRYKALEDRDYEHHGVSSIQRTHLVVKLANQIAGFYDKGKKRQFWLAVEKLAQASIDKALAER